MTHHESRNCVFIKIRLKSFVEGFFFRKEKRKTSFCGGGVKIWEEEIEI